jgi:hypothetical protein
MRDESVTSLSDPRMRTQYRLISAKPFGLPPSFHSKSTSWSLKRAMSCDHWLKKGGTLNPSLAPVSVPSSQMS